MQIKGRYAPIFKNTAAFSHVHKFLCVQCNVPPSFLLACFYTFLSKAIILSSSIVVLLSCLSLSNVLLLSRHFLLSFALQLAVVSPFNSCLSDRDCFTCFSTHITARTSMHAHTHTHTHTHTSGGVAVSLLLRQCCRSHLNVSLDGWIKMAEDTTSLWSSLLLLWVTVCVCVCVCERERERYYIL